MTNLQEFKETLKSIWENEEFEMHSMIIWIFNITSLPISLTILIARLVQFIVAGPKEEEERLQDDYLGDEKIPIEKKFNSFWISKKWTDISNISNFAILLTICVSLFALIQLGAESRVKSLEDSNDPRFTIFGYNSNKNVALYVLLINFILQAFYLTPLLIKRQKISGTFALSFITSSLIFGGLYWESQVNSKLKLPQSCHNLLLILLLVSVLAALKFIFLPCRYFAEPGTNVLRQNELNLFSRLTFIYFLPSALSVWFHNNGQDGRKGLDFAPQELADGLTTNIMNEWNKQRYKAQSYTAIWCLVFKSHKFAIVRIILLRLIGIATRFTFPILTHLLQIWYNHEDFHKGSWQRHFLIVGFILSVLVEAVAQNQYFHASTSLQRKIMAGLTQMIYDKILKLSIHTEEDKERACRTFGFIGNDIPSVTTFIVNLPIMLAAPPELLLYFVLLYYYISYAIIIAFLFTLGVMSITVLIVSRSKTLLKNQLIAKDRRTNALRDVLSGIKIIKMHAWENHFLRKISAIRTEELGYLREESIYHNISTNLWNVSAVMLILISLFSYIFIVKRNTPVSEINFTNIIQVIYPLATIRGPLCLLPMTFLSLSLAQTYSSRLHQFLLLSESDDDNYLSYMRDDSKIAVHIKESKYMYDPLQAGFTLHLNNMMIDEGSLVGIAGKVGSGKSSFVSALLGQMVLLNNEGSLNTLGNSKIYDDKKTIRIKKSIALSQQEAWIQSCTIRDNILFCKEYENSLYSQVLKACALTEDIYNMPLGDFTNLGEKGINISGGQKQRLALARSVYSKRQLYILDDPLSAVDVHVGKHIFQNCICNEGMLNNTTRLFISNNPEYLKECDRVLVFEEGRIIGDGHFTLLANQHSFLQALASEQPPESVDHHSNVTHSTGGHSVNIASLPSNLNDFDPALLRSPFIAPNDEVRIENFDDTQEPLNQNNDQNADLLPNSLIYAGSNSSAMAYFLLFTKAILIVCLLSFILAIGFSVTSEYFLYIFLNRSKMDPMESDGKLKHRLYLYLFCLFSIIQVAVLALFFSFVTIGSQNASKRLHKKVLNSLLHWKLSEFQKVNSGAIINSMSKDLFNCDFEMPKMLHIILLTSTGIIIPTIQIIIIDVKVSLPILFTICGVYFVQQIYIVSIKKYGGNEAALRAPLLGKMTETFNGLVTIQAMNSEEDMMRSYKKSISDHVKNWYLMNLSHRWAFGSLEIIGTITIIIYFLVLHFLEDVKNQGVRVAYILMNIKKMFVILVWTIRILCDFDLYSLSFARIAILRKQQTEASWSTIQPLKNCKNEIVKQWPSNGEIKFYDVDYKYEGQSSYVLKGINLNISPNTRVGIVGRSGAGKSSLISALFRVEDVSSGSIMIDDVDINSLGLHQLRSHLSLIPQDPIIFEASLRENLDPEGYYKNADRELFDYLKLIGLEHFDNLDCQGDKYSVLDAMCRDECFSLGQKQLICLLRALMRKSKILVLDEATASVDNQTDALIQKLIREQFNDTTIMTVAHRIKTIIDYDQVIVMSFGRIIECGTPRELIAKRGDFYEMCKKSKLLDD